VLPAEMIFTGIQPKDVSPEDIAKIEETESRMFQNYLFSAILRYANSNRYYTAVGVQDISTTQKLLEDNKISVRDSWRQDDKELARLLGVDAVVRMRIQKKRYMSDLASFGVGYGQQVLYQIGNVGRYIPYVPNKTNDIYASCNIVSNNQTLWNDDYRGSSNYTVSSEKIISDGISHIGKESRTSLNDKSGKNSYRFFITNPIILLYCCCGGRLLQDTFLHQVLSYLHCICCSPLTEVIAHDPHVQSIGLCFVPADSANKYFVFLMSP